MERLDNNPAIAASDILAFSCVRNEAVRLPYFLEYHRGLGVDRFVVIDNGSTDGTREFLLSQPDTLVFYTEESYAASACGMDWLHQLLAQFGSGHWIVTLDADEMLIYPECERMGLRELTRYLEETGAEALKTFLIDMYSDKPIRETHYSRGRPFLEYCAYFDGDAYFELDKEGIPGRGGPRHRLFWEGYDRDKNSPYMVNVPLVRWREDLAYKRGTHLITGVRLSPMIGAKLHFKFFSDFYAYAETEAQRKEHWDGAAQYVSYWDVLSKNPDLSAIYSGSVKYEDSRQIVKLGLMRSPDSYQEFVRKRTSPLHRLFRYLRRR